MNTIRLELHKMTEAEVFTWHKFEATGFSARQLSTVLAQLVYTGEVKRVSAGTKPPTFRKGQVKDVLLRDNKAKHNPKPEKPAIVLPDLPGNVLWMMGYTDHVPPVMPKAHWVETPEDLEIAA